jgi:ribosome biogenesis protein ENP2
LSDPFAYDKFLEERKKEKMKQLLGDRIVVNRNKHVKVNKQLADNIKTEENKEVIKDNRFSKLFTDKNYEIDYNSESFAKKMKKTKSNDDEKTDFLNEKDNSSEEDAVNKKIVNPNLFKLQEKLISKKRKKIDSLFGNNEDELEETIEEKLKNKSNEKDDEEDFDLVTKIKKFEVSILKVNYSRKTED